MFFVVFFIGVSACQRENGSFSGSIEGTEHDMRFVYCAACICAMLNDWTGIDKQKMVQYILDSIVSKYLFNQYFMFTHLFTV
jgi:geranylgeranyl transferase type-1 subunit beta